MRDAVSASAPAWKAGDVMVGDRGQGLDMVELTHVGDTHAMGILLAYRVFDGPWRPSEFGGRQHVWHFCDRAWRAATDEEIAEAKVDS